MDKVTPEVRSRVMASIRSKDTRPEMVVRRAFHRAGLRYRLHVTGLPGQPDLVFPSRHLVVFVHGCFWHGCPSCRDGTKSVKSNVGYWRPKLTRNRERDINNVAALEAEGWSVRVVWECQTKDDAQVAALVAEVRAMAKVFRRGAGNDAHCD